MSVCWYVTLCGEGVCSDVNGSCLCVCWYVRAFVSYVAIHTCRSGIDIVRWLDRVRVYAYRATARWPIIIAYTYIIIYIPLRGAPWGPPPLVMAVYLVLAPSHCRRSGLSVVTIRACFADIIAKAKLVPVTVCVLIAKDLKLLICILLANEFCALRFSRNLEQCSFSLMTLIFQRPVATVVFSLLV